MNIETKERTEKAKDDLAKAIMDLLESFNTEYGERVKLDVIYDRFVPENIGHNTLCGKYELNEDEKSVQKIRITLY
jgi:phosphoribosylformylglycinamidine (FGAM) synthase-like enzyme